MRAKALFLALFFVAVVVILISTVSASTINRTYTKTGGVITCDNKTLGYNKYIKDEIEAGKPIIVVYKGEKISFSNSTGYNLTGLRIDGIFTSTGISSSNFKTSFISNEWDTEGKYEGYYRFSDNANTSNDYFGSGDYQGWLSLDTHTFRVELYPADKTYADGSLILRMESNNKEAGFMKFTIESQGHSIQDITGNEIYEITIEYTEETKFCNISEDISGIALQDGDIVLNMFGLDVEVGGYTIILEDFATGIEKKINFDIEAREIEIDTRDTIVKGEIAEIIVSSAFSHKNVRLLIDDGDVLSQSATLDEEGEKMFRWNTSGSQVHVGKHDLKIEVDVDGDGKFGGLEDEEASRSIEVVEGDVSIELSSDTVIIGDQLRISGKSNYGSYAAIVIDDTFMEKAKITREKFEYGYKTVGEIEGTKKIEVFIDAPIEFGSGEEVSAVWKLKNGADADAEFALIVSRVLTLDVPPATAKGDDVVIQGTANGTDSVYLLVLNGRGEVIFPYEAVAVATEVRDDTYEEKLIKPDVGEYTVIALHKGRDGVTDAIQDGKWVVGDRSKTMDLKVAIVEDAITRAGSDDLSVKKEFKVVTPEVNLKLEDATFGEDLTIVATTNVKEGAMAWIRVEKEGSEERVIKTIKVENGTIRAEFDTNKLSIGRWKVTVDIPDRCSDEGVINIKVKAEASTPAPTATPVATAAPSPTPPPSGLTVAGEKIGIRVPGFELISSLAVLIAIAYLRRKRRRKGRFSLPPHTLLLSLVASGRIVSLVVQVRNRPIFL